MKFSETQVLASLVKESFYDFVIEFWHTIITEPAQLNWHVKVMCDEMQAMAERVFKGEKRTHDLIVNIPPGATKSTICSQMFIAWVWTRMPSAKFICVSYAHQVALKDSLKTRDIVESELYKRCFPEVRLRQDENMKELFSNTKKGFRLSAGIGGAVTGYHAHFLLIDDPINPQESNSDAELRSVNRWMEQTIPSRRVNKDVSVLVLVQQRLHQSDPSGEMLERTRGKGGLKHICLPGELTEDVQPPELAAKYVDGLLDPVRLPRTALDSIRSELGEYGYASQILQTPVAPGGGQFNLNKLQLEDDCGVELVRTCRSWDKAGTQDGGAYSVGVLMGVDANGEFWILDVERGRWNATKREQRIQMVAQNDGVEVPILIEIEGGSGGKESGEATVRNLAGYRVITYHPTGDKETRAYPLSTQVGAGNVHVLRRPWLRDLLEEMRFFPKSKYKDQVDGMSGGFNYLARKRTRIGGWKTKKSGDNKDR